MPRWVETFRALPEPTPVEGTELGEGFRLRPVERRFWEKAFEFGWALGHDCREGALIAKGRCVACNKAVPTTVLNDAPIKAAALRLRYFASPEPADG